MHVGIALWKNQKKRKELIYGDRKRKGNAARPDLSFNDAAQAFLSDRQEDVPRPRRTARINGDTNTAIGRIFEAGGHRERRREFTVDLRLGGTSANGTP